MKTKCLITALLLPVLLCLNCTSDTTIPPQDDQEQVDTAEQTTEDENTGQDTGAEATALELKVNDLEPHPMQDIEKPSYLATITDPSFGTTIRRISDAGGGKVIKPMYSTIQAWNTDETYLILYNQSEGVHQLLDGMEYTFIRNLDDIDPADIEQLFWDFNDPDILFYVDSTTGDFIEYAVNEQKKEIITNFKNLTNCADTISLGNDVQMVSWDSDVIGFRCANTAAYAYSISTGELISFVLDDVAYTAPMPSAGGSRFYHQGGVYNTNGRLTTTLNEKKVEHSCLGKLANGNDAHFAVAFAEGPQGACIGNIIAHDMATGECFPVISEEQGYDYPKTGTHISAVAHKNPGWIAASMIGYEEDGQKLLDQELILARVEKGNIEVYRIGHHRADENEFDYWGEPHAVISPTGTRVLFGSDWSGTEDGKSVDSYVVELPSFKK